MTHERVENLHWPSMAPSTQGVPSTAGPWLRSAPCPGESSLQAILTQTLVAFWESPFLESEISMNHLFACAGCLLLTISNTGIEDRCSYPIASHSLP